MKRIILSAVAGLMVAAPLTAAPAMAQQYGNDRYNNDRHDNDRSDNDQRNNGRYDNDRRDNDRHGNKDWRDDRRDARWDDNRHNGYWVGKAWHWGPPPASYYRRADFRLGWHAWHKGDRLGYFNRRYTEVDWRSRHLKAPPRGYHYVQDNNGDIILAVIATGLIASIIANNG